MDKWLNSGIRKPDFKCYHFHSLGVLYRLTICLTLIASVFSSIMCSAISACVWPHALQPTGLLCPWNFSGKITGAGCYFLLQGIFLSQGSNQHLLCLLHWQEGSLPLVPPGKPFSYQQSGQNNGVYYLGLLAGLNQVMAVNCII